MSKHGLQAVKSSRPTAVEPEVIEPVGNDAAPSLFSLNARDAMGLDVAKGSIEIARMIVDGAQKIATIRANSEAAVAQIAAEIDRLSAEAKAYVDKTRADSEAWHGKFEDRRKLVESFLSRLDDHPEWPDALRAKIVDAAIAAMGVS